MHFPNAFKKVFIPSMRGNSLTLKTTGKTQDLIAGEIGFYNAKTYAALATAPSDPTPFLLVQGNYHTVDKIGPFHGGYQESIKSKVINPKYISRFFKVEAKEAKNQIVSVQNLAFKCGTTYNLRIDVKGSPALRFLNHNLYHTFDVFTGCCADDCSVACTNDPVDPAVVMKAFADQINGDPIISNFVKANAYVGATLVTDAYVPEIFDGTNAATIAAIQASLKLEVAYADTKYGDCTFSVRDHYELEPLFIFVSMTDETGDPCAEWPVANTSTGQNVTEDQAPVQASGVGETVLRDLILSQRYLQEPFPDGGSVESLRLREVFNDKSLEVVDRNGLYDKIYLLHNVPRFNNSQSIFDNDQYLLEIDVPTGTDVTALTTFIQDVLDNAGNGVKLETF